MKKAWNDALKMPLNSLPEADLNLPEMKTKSPSCPSGGVHMYGYNGYTGIYAPWNWCPKIAAYYTWEQDIIQ